MSYSDIENGLNSFSMLANSHSIWECDLLQKMSATAYRQDELAFIFQQHYYYSKNFTRLLCLVAGHLDKSTHRALIAENLYEEAGEGNTENRHSALMHTFLNRIGVKSVNDEDIKHFTKCYVEKCIGYIKKCDAIEATAFMAWGAEGIVPKLYQIFIDALKFTGYSEKDYHYLKLHIECDDGHHETLVNIVAELVKDEISNFSLEVLMQRVSKSIEKSLDFRKEYFNSLYREIEHKPLYDLYTNINYSTPQKYQIKLLNNHHSKVKKHTLYENTDKMHHINFNVARIPFNMESLDPRILTILPAMKNETHKHAHETFFYVLSGSGNCYINNEAIPIKCGAMIHVPRWALHYTINLGTEDLVILAVTDYNLTRRFFENTEKSYRKVPENIGQAVHP